MIIDMGDLPNTSRYSGSLDTRIAKGNKAQDCPGSRSTTSLGFMVRRHSPREEYILVEQTTMLNWQDESHSISSHLNFPLVLSRPRQGLLSIVLAMKHPDSFHAPPLNELDVGQRSPITEVAPSVRASVALNSRLGAILATG